MDRARPNGFQDPLLFVLQEKRRAGSPTCGMEAWAEEEHGQNQPERGRADGAERRQQGMEVRGVCDVITFPFVRHFMQKEVRL